MDFDSPVFRRRSLAPAILTATVLSLGLITVTPAAAQNTGADCSGIASTDFPNPTTQITSAEFQEAHTAQGRTPAAPDHCEVLGRMNERTGMFGQPYAIRFHMRLPVEWNGKFFFEGGGGSNGNLGMAYGNLQGGQPENALQLGYAVVSTDSGHDNQVNNDPERGGTTTFGFDPQARIDFGYNSYDQVTQAAKAIIAQHYGRAPERSYYVGCSEGGREAMMMSQRFPDYFDGILACAPGMSLQEAALFGHSWDVQSFAQAAEAIGAEGSAGEPLLNKTFTDEDLNLAAKAVLKACDGLDGLEDGLIDDFTGCTTAVVDPELASITCSGEKTASCLTATQVDALKRVYGGARDSDGDILYADWAWDRGIGGELPNGYNMGWRIWKIGMYPSPQNSAIITGLGGGAVAAVFTTPPTQLPGAGPEVVEYLDGIDINTAAPLLEATSGEYTTPVADFMKADSTDLDPFKDHGGKLVIVQGVSDPVFSIMDTVHWWDRVNALQGGEASDFVRLFAVPGMNHCAGGPATDQYNAFGALVDWVENGKAPDRITATAGANTPWPGRTRPLCAYPKQARYSGKGSIEDAASFVCE